MPAADVHGDGVVGALDVPVKLSPEPRAWL